MQGPFPEEQRRRVLGGYSLKRGDISGQLDRLARLAARLCDAPTGLVSIVGANEQVFVGRSGTGLSATPREYSFCSHAMHGNGPMIVPDAQVDQRFSDNPLVTENPRIRFYAGHPLVSPEGAPLGTLCVIDNRPRDGLTPEQRDALAALADAVMALLERSRVERASELRQAQDASSLHDLEERFRVLADDLPQLVWSTRSDGMSDYFNRGWCNYTGAPEASSIGAGWMDFLHRDDHEVTARAWRDAVGSGEPYEVEYRLRNGAGEHRWMLARGLPIRDRQGRVARWIGTCTDIHEQHRAVERESLLSRELDHRIKNIFAVISGLVSLTMRGRPELADVGEGLRDRILALGRAHDLVRISSQDHREQSGTTLVALLQALLSPYRSETGDRISIDGEDIVIDDRSATPFALYFHELATNASKYGALSVPGGLVEIEIVPGEEIEISWREAGGPPAVPGPRSGFGEKLIEMAITRQLGGSLDYDWRAEGLAVVARVPAASLTR